MHIIICKMHVSTLEIKINCAFICIMVYHVNELLQVRIPSADTTYWCRTVRLPQYVIDETHYITSVREN